MRLATGGPWRSSRASRAQAENASERRGRRWRRAARERGTARPCAFPVAAHRLRETFFAEFITGNTIKFAIVIRIFNNIIFIESVSIAPTIPFINLC